MARFTNVGLVLLTAALCCSTVQADDWLRFRGPNGGGVDAAKGEVPVRWSPTQNVEWKTSLPGAGVSCPIVVGNRIFVTCYSGYGMDRREPGDINDLKRHLVCVDANSGQMMWEKSVDAVQPEDPYSGAGVPAHGYASHTPVSDGENVYVFFGKTGALAYDMEGNQLWQTMVGKESDPRKWGSSSSPILFEDLVIITASCESQALVALDKKTGKEVWRQEAAGLDNLWGTPALVETETGGTELVVGVAGEVWGLNPLNGKLRWYCKTGESEQASTSVVVSGDMVYFAGGRGAGTVAVKTGGTGNVTDTHVKWTGRDAGRFGSPLVYDGNFYAVTNNIVTKLDAASGESAGQVRISTSGGRRASDYASPIVLNNHLYYLKGDGTMCVFNLEGEMEQIATNRVTTEAEAFGATPAVADGKIFLRSDKHLYCVTKGPFDESKEPKADPADDDEGADEGGRGGGRGGRGGQGGGRQGFSLEDFFNQNDQNKDKKLSKEELPERLQANFDTWDGDKDGGVTLEELQTGIRNMQRGGRGGRGGGGRGGRGGRGGEGDDDGRPDRPQRPPFDEGIGE